MIELVTCLFRGNRATGHGLRVFCKDDNVLQQQDLVRGSVVFGAPFTQWGVRLKHKHFRYLLRCHGLISDRRNKTDIQAVIPPASTHIEIGA